MNLLHQDEKRLWREYCAPVQLPIDNFKEIQARLLAEQIELASNGSWPPSLPSAQSAASVEEFRARVPLRRWEEYRDLLHPEGMDGQVKDVRYWIQTSWSEGGWKKVPWTQRFYEAQCRHVIAAFMLSVASEAGDVRIGNNFRVLPFLPDTPFASAFLSLGVSERNVVNVLFPREQGSDVPLARRFKSLFDRGLEEGADCIVGMSSTLMMARREFRRMAEASGPRDIFNRNGGGAALRWASARLRHGRQRDWEPRSVFKPKTVIAWGADTARLAPALEEQWGAPVFELYASSEGGIMAMHDWRKQALTPLPTSVFMEFLPLGAPAEPSELLLLDELEVGQAYELVLSSFYGMPFMRLRQGDLLRVVGHNEFGVPQFDFYRRGDNIIDLGSIARINEPTLTAALLSAGGGDGAWLARKEYVNERPMLVVYAGADAAEAQALQPKLHRALGAIDHHYREATYTLGYTLMQVRPWKAAADVAANGNGFATIEPSSLVPTSLP